MSQTYKGSINFPSNFDVQTTAPLDNRIVVDSKKDLINGSIKSPYQGMVVNIKGTSELWILQTQGIAESMARDEFGNPKNWKLVTGTGSGSNGLSKYSIPVMTEKMAEDATNDPDVDFDGSEDPYIITDYDGNSLSGETTTNTITSINGTYLDIMMRAIRSLQAEVARLKNSFEYGIDSYKNLDTAKSAHLNEYSSVDTAEPLWAIDEGYLSAVSDSVVFNTYLDKNHSFETYGEGSIDVSIDGQLTFNNCAGVFHDGVKSGDGYDNYTLYELSDQKIITYLVTDKPYITIRLLSLDNKNDIETINLKHIMNDTVSRYGYCIVLSRKTKTSKENEFKGFNYLYISLMNYDTGEKLKEGYWNGFGLQTEMDENCEFSKRYSIGSLKFGDTEDPAYTGMTLYRMKFYTKYEDFSEEVISSAPNEDDWKYGTAHITIRSVEDSSILEKVKDQLKEDELVWNKKNKTLHIKSNGKMCLIGSNKNTDDNIDDNMTNKEIIEALTKMGIVVNVKYVQDASGNDTDEIESVENMSLSPISDFTFVNNDTGKKFNFSVDNEGNLVGRDKSAETISEFMTRLGSSAGNYDKEDYKAVRGFISDFLYRKSGEYTTKNGVNYAKDAGKKSDRLRISSFYAPLETDSVHGCTHSFIELENTSDVDIPLTGVYLHFYNPAADEYKGKVYHLALDGVIKSGGTYLIRGAKHAEYDDVSAFIKVKSYDREWYNDGKLLSFEQEEVKTEVITDDKGTSTKISDDSKIKTAYRFCLTYGLPDLKADTRLVSKNASGEVIDGTSFSSSDFPWIIKNPRFIDSCSFSSFSGVSSKTGDENPWYANGASGIGITITPNTMFRLMFALDPAKQAYNGFNAKDGSRTRYNKATDIQILNLDKEFIGYPKSNETIKISRFTPKASYENRNVMTDKTQLDSEKPNMITCSFGIDVYNTRCFNWISCGVFDEYVWIRKKGDTNWIRFQSYTKVSADKTEGTELPRRKEYPALVNNTVYARMTDRFPGNNMLFTAHKCVVVFPDAESDQIVYEYVVGRPDKNGNPDPEHTNEIYMFTLSPRTYEGRVYQITDQQGFHWIEYQVWAASAEFLNKKIKDECDAINAGSSNTKIFPILINTGDMTQSGSRINEWLDYYNAGKSLFNHMEQINCVGNNDLCDIDPHNLGTGNDTNKSNSHFFHYFYCFDLKDEDRLELATEDNKKFFNGESLVVKAHDCTVDGITTAIPDRYIPSTYYFKTKNVMYVMVNSELPEPIGQKWFGLCSTNNKYVNIYTGIETNADGEYDKNIHNYFTPVYETLYAWLDDNKKNGNRKLVFAMHEMPFTVITATSLNNQLGSQYMCTRNYPTGGSRLGSNTNQLNVNENRGIYWCSRLLEYFGCKIVIGGHKHTYALTYPVKERYIWTHDGETHDSKDGIKPMSSTLSDEAGQNPEYDIKWSLSLSPDDSDTFNVIFGDKSSVELSSTKIPYVPKNLYERYGKSAFEKDGTNTVRCCSPFDINDEKYDGFVSYSMCQATGYKLKSNKELPSCVQVFSKIVPQTTNTWNDSKKSFSDGPNANQLYPMYSVLEFNDDCSELDVRMSRIHGIFKADGKDSFTQLNYGTNDMTNTYLCQNYKYSASNQTLMNALESVVDGDICYRTDEKKYYKYINKVWTEYKEMMYGGWEKTLPTEPDKNYLHIKF